MTDLYDRATEREEEILADALAAQARRSGLTGKTLADSALTCAVCDEPIALARREAVPGVQTCLFCQQDLENATGTRR